MKLALFTAAGQKGNSGQLSNQLCGIYTTLSCHQRTDANTTSPWVIIHLGTILCIHRTDVVHWFRSLSGTCQSITSAIWAPRCTNNSPQGRMRKRWEEKEEGRRQKGWIHLPETSSFFFFPGEESAFHAADVYLNHFLYPQVDKWQALFRWWHTRDSTVSKTINSGGHKLKYISCTYGIILF